MDWAETDKSKIVGYYVFQAAADFAETDAQLLEEFIPRIIKANTSGTKIYDAQAYIDSGYQQLQNGTVAGPSGFLYGSSDSGAGGTFWQINQAGTGIGWGRRIANSATSITGVATFGTDIYTSFRNSGNMILCKWNESGVLQWQRSVNGMGDNAWGNLHATVDSVFLMGFSGTRATVLKYPIDGSITGTWSINSQSVAIAASSATFNNVTPAFSNPGIGFNTVTGNEGATTRTVNAITPSPNVKVSIP
jgi:hypothetical protein